MHKLKVTINNYDSWEFTQDDIKVDVPNLIPSKHKLLHDDLIFFKDDTVVIVESFFRDTIIAGVLILNKTYGRSGKRLLYKCIPDNKRLPVFLVPYDVGASFNKVVKNKYIAFRFINWDNDHPHGEIKETLGDVDCNSAFSEYQLYKRGLNISLTAFSNATRSLIKRTGTDEAIYIQTILDTTKYGIEDWRSTENVFTIDPEGCTDFDDAFSTSEENGVATVNVYIANVYVWLETYGLWSHMTDRVSTIYLPDKKHPMLPPLLSDTLCSLKQGADRFAFMMSIQYDMTTLEQIGEPNYKNVLINVKKNYIYEDKKLGKNPAYKVLRTLANTNDSHEVVAFWMIKMNTACAEHLHSVNKGIFRGTPPGESALITPKPIPLPILSWLGNHGSNVIYTEVCVPHSQLGVDAYVHITSPIRRLADILNQILFQSDISDSCQTFLDKWRNNLDFVNRATKDIRKTQMDCELLALVNNSDNQDYSGILFDRNLVSGRYEYAVYIEELKMVSRIKSNDYIENFTKSQFRIFVFNDEDRLCKKIRLQIY